MESPTRQTNKCQSSERRHLYINFYQLSLSSLLSPSAELKRLGARRFVCRCGTRTTTMTRTTIGQFGARRKATNWPACFTAASCLSLRARNEPRSEGRLCARCHCTRGAPIGPACSNSEVLVIVGRASFLLFINSVARAHFHRDSCPAHLLPPSACRPWHASLAGESELGKHALQQQ